MKSAFGTNLFLALLMAGCATQQRPIAPAPVELPPAPTPATTATGAHLSSPSFNPAAGESVTFTYETNASGPVTVAIWDADGGLIRAWPAQGSPVKVSWDGRDQDGAIVPNEAYTFTVRDASGALLYNPFSTSGGERIDVSEVDWRPEEQRLLYHLPVPCRMLVRAGTKPGPLLASIVDWEPRRAGEIIEVWNGLDDTGRFYVPGMAGFILTLSGYHLPESTIITTGGKAPEFLQYRRDHPASETIPTERSDAPARHALYGKPLAAILSPRLAVALADGSSPPEIRLSGQEQVNLTLTLDGLHGPGFQQRRFEITVYIDNEPYMEEGQPYLPYVFPLKAQYFTPGSHVLTFNVSNFTNQFSEYSVKIGKE